MRINVKSKKFVAAAVAATVLTGGGAYAYWSAGGGGTGTAATAAAADALTVNQTNDLEPMFPGDAPQTLSGTFGNTSDGLVYVTSVTASIASVVDVDDDTDPLIACTASDYTLAGAVMTVGAEVAVGDPVGAWTGATIQFNNTGVNQDACKGAIVSLSYLVA